jgi:hypothetical protein
MSGVKAYGFRAAVQLVSEDQGKAAKNYWVFWIRAIVTHFVGEA